MSKFASALLCASIAVAAPASAQVRQTREQILFYTQGWKGARFPDGRPKLPDEVLDRAVKVSLEDVWDYLQSRGYRNQFEGGLEALHGNRPFAGRALTAKFLPARPDMRAAVGAEGKQEGRVGGTNEWVISELRMGDTMVVDGYGKVVKGTIIGSNLGSGIAAHTRSGFVFYGGIRDAEELRELPGLNGFYLGYDPSAWSQMQLTGINVPVRIGRAVVLPGDLVLAKKDGVIFIPAVLAEGAINSADFSKLQDSYNFALNYAGKNGAMFEGGWTKAKFDALRAWVSAHSQELQNLRMTRAEFDAEWTRELAESEQRAARRAARGEAR